jgi:hypothetical protein
MKKRPFCYENLLPMDFRKCFQQEFKVFFTPITGKAFYVHFNYSYMQNNNVIVRVQAWNI